MGRITLSFTCTKTCSDRINKSSESLGLNRSTYEESLNMVYQFNNGFIPDAHQLENLRKNYLVNDYSNMTGDFRNQILSFTPSGQISILKFIYRLNLSGIKFSTKKQANLSKDGELCCYFALGYINHRLVNIYLNSFNLNVHTIGPSSANDNDYLFFSNKQQLKIKKSYTKFTDLLKALSKPSDKTDIPLDTEVIKVHYSKLDDIADAMKII